MRIGMARAPRWASAVLALGLVALGFLIYVFVNPPTPPEATVSPSGSGSSPSPTVPNDDPAFVLVIGDAITAGSAEGGWPARVTAAQEAAGQPVDLDVLAAAGVGYGRVGADGLNFQGLVESAEGGYDVVIFFGSQSDNAAAVDIQGAANRAFAAARAASPNAALVAIGPAWSGGSPPSYIVTNRDGIAAAAAEDGVTFVDPLAEGWFATGVDAELLGLSGQSPTEDGHAFLAERIGPVLQQALAAAAQG